MTPRAALLLGACAVLIAAAAASGNPRRRTPPNAIRYDRSLRFLPRFVLSYWCGPPPSETTDERYHEIRAAGFNLVMPSCGGSSVELNRRIIAASDRQHLVAIIADPRMPLRITGEKDALERIDSIVADYRELPGFGGYFLTDEPSASAFPGLGEVVRALKERDPEHPAFINLFPNYATPQQLGTATYREYLHRYIATVAPPVLSYDHYHFKQREDGGQFFENLALVREASLASRLPFWNIVLLTAHGPYRDLTEGEIRWEASQSLAYGARGVLYFTYWTPEDPEWNFRLGAIEKDGRRTHHYDMVRNCNTETAVLGNVLASLQPGRVYHAGTVPLGGQPMPADAPLIPDRGDFTFGEFQDYYQHKTVLAVNGDYRSAQQVSFRVSPSVSHMDQYDPLQGSWRRITIPPGHRYISASFSAGGAGLFRVR